jgi:prophage antirepressor-like protein
MIPTRAAAPTLFQFEGQPVRVIDRDGLLWFVLVDVCRVLEIINVSQCAGRLDSDEKDGICITYTPTGQTQTVLVVNESGLYSVILTSRKPEARRFKKWITSEVLPSIRKTGRYETAAAKADHGEAPPPDLQEAARILVYGGADPAAAAAALALAYLAGLTCLAGKESSGGRRARNARYYAKHRGEILARRAAAKSF